MKQIAAYIRATRVAPVLQALYRNESVSGVSCWDVRGFSRNRSTNGNAAVLQDLVNAAPYVKLEIVCADDSLSELIETIELLAHTGNPGDGKLFVADVTRARRISTGEHDEAAVSGPERIEPLAEPCRDTSPFDEPTDG
jgi:nitrogen regulatory protein PII